MKVTFAVALLLASLAGADAVAQFGGQPPSGTYSRTCSQETMIGSVLVAECKDQNNIKIKTRLYVRDCFGDIENVFGELVCHNRRLPSGSYSRTCTACSADGGSLQCTCNDTKQRPIKTKLDLTSCAWGSGVTNKDGHLQCD